MQITKFSLPVQKLYQQVQQQAQCSIVLEDNGRRENWLAFDQSGHKKDNAGKIHLEMAQSSNPDFTLAHELRHLQVELSDFAQVRFPVTSSQPELDRDLQVCTIALIGSVEHILIMQQHYQNQEITAAIKDDFKRGLRKQLVPETTDVDHYFIFDTLVMLDALTFSQGEDLDEWQQHYPHSWAAAQQLYQLLASKLEPTAFSLRRQEVRLFNQFNQILQNQQFPLLPFQEFVALEPVLSQRQLRLNVNQVFQIKHLDFSDRQTSKRALALVGLNDQQMVSTLYFAAEPTPEQYRQLYQLPVSQFLQLQKIHYYLR
ncbi:hypothetical protein [Bombilactobacillus bombi]|uniref:hypothetical protein n=1 Tax=Bombilactobacillus bombi TaxID=1303590 RepID=UPI0015E62851|nr:hypothetical protein [Bombilactobacillus bombi]MBA1434240.1 hypothetical protein [Bombilactobacillus bombi]